MSSSWATTQTTTAAHLLRVLLPTRKALGDMSHSMAHIRGSTLPSSGVPCTDHNGETQPWQERTGRRGAQASLKQFMKLGAGLNHRPAFKGNLRQHFNFPSRPTRIQSAVPIHLDQWLLNVNCSPEALLRC